MQGSLIKPGNTNSEAIETLLTPIDSHNRSSGVGFGNAPIPLQNYHLCPDLVINAVPLVENLLNMVLKSNRIKNEVISIIQL